MVFGISFFSSKNKKVDFSVKFDAKEFLLDALVKFNAELKNNLKEKEALVNDKTRYKYFRSDDLINYLVENAGMFFCID